jgi:hypothetical protein
MGAPKGFGGSGATQNTTRWMNTFALTAVAVSADLVAFPNVDGNKSS